MRERAPYGSCWAVQHKEAYLLWVSRDDEPAESPTFGMRALMVLEDDEDKSGADCAYIWRLAERCLNRSQMNVLIFRYEHGMTLEEIGARLFLTGARVRQIEMRAMDTLRSMTAKPNV